MIDTSSPVPDLGMYLALGRAALKEREEVNLRKAAQAEAERRAAIYREWKPLLERIEQEIPYDFLRYVVEPEKGYREGLNSGGVRGLVYDLTPLGLAKVTAFADTSKADGLSWLAPHAVESATGEKFSSHYTEVHRSVREREGVTFFEALAQCAALVEEIAHHNEWVTSPKPVAESESNGASYLGKQTLHTIDLPAEPALAQPAKAVYPVLRVGTDRHEVHAGGELDAIEFGHKYGAKGWADRCAVHTFKLLDVPDFGELYVYLTLVPVAPGKWDKLMGSQEG